MLKIIFGNDYEKITKYISKEPVASYKRVLSLSGITNYLHQKTLLEASEGVTEGYIVRYDLDFLKATEKDWQSIKDISATNNIILIYQDLDKRSKFYKFFADCCVEYRQVVENKTFTLVDLTIQRDKKAFDFVHNVYPEDVIGFLSLLYSRFRCILQIQTTPDNINISDNTGLDNRTVYWCKKYCNIYSDEELVNVLRWINIVIQYIIEGVIESKYAIDYLFLNIL
jgi:hypothetical protein